MMSKLMVVGFAVAFLTPSLAVAQQDRLQFCAIEGQSCRVEPHQAVFYGALGSYEIRLGNTFAQPEFICAPNMFLGDPMRGQRKACYVDIQPRLQPCDQFQCNFSGEGMVVINAQSGLFGRTFANGSPCDGRMFPPFDIGPVTCQWFPQSLEGLERMRFRAMEAESFRPPPQPTAGVIFGRITDPSNRPIPGAVARVFVSGAQFQNTYPTGPGGQFFVAQAFAGSYSISLEAPGYVPVNVRIAVRPGEQVDIGQIRLLLIEQPRPAPQPTPVIVQPPVGPPSLPTTGTIRGRVVDDSNKAIAGAEIRIGGPGSRPTAITGPNGEFVTGPLQFGNYSIAVTKPSFKEKLQSASLHAGRPHQELLVQLSYPQADGQLRADGTVEPSGGLRIWNPFDPQCGETRQGACTICLVNKQAMFVRMWVNGVAYPNEIGMAVLQVTKAEGRPGPNTVVIQASRVFSWGDVGRTTVNCPSGGKLIGYSFDGRLSTF